MMKIKTKNTLNPRKRKLIIALCILFATSTVAYCIYNFTPIFHDPTTKNDAKTETLNNNDATNSQTKENSVPINENVDSTKSTSEIPTSDTVSIQITQLSQDSEYVTYAADISNPGTNGTCSAVFTNQGSRPVTSDTPSLDGKCGPVSIPSTSFTLLGEWLLTLRYYSDNTQAVSTGTIDIK